MRIKYVSGFTYLQSLLTDVFEETRHTKKLEFSYTSIFEAEVIIVRN